ncbi:MAG: hypothetical protein HY518_00990 [Candidatus Aenigmarchaeota archaeon]|nr:hypothetical protein [Candidatus Aenigmarchaeota archaeon]
MKISIEAKIEDAIKAAPNFMRYLQELGKVETGGQYPLKKDNAGVALAVYLKGRFAGMLDIYENRDVYFNGYRKIIKISKPEGVLNPDIVRLSYTERNGREDNWNVPFP